MACLELIPAPYINDAGLILHQSTHLIDMNLFKYAMKHIQPHQGSQVHHVPGSSKHRRITQFQVL